MTLTPHGFCLQWRPDVLIPTLVGDLGISLAYFLIPLALFLWARKQDVPFYPFRAILKLFAAFILLCGISHIIDIIVIYYPIYYIAAIERVATAVVSLITVIVLLRLRGTKTRKYTANSHTYVDLEFPPIKT